MPSMARTKAEVRQLLKAPELREDVIRGLKNRYPFKGVKGFFV